MNMNPAVANIRCGRIFRYNRIFASNFLLFIEKVNKLDNQRLLYS